nr:hypothetical protein [Streptomyces bingchenggensis]
MLHGPGQPLAEHPVAVEAAARELGEHQPPHVGGGGDGRGAGRGPGAVLALGGHLPLAVGAVAAGPFGGDGGGVRLGEGGAGHAERLEDVAADVRVEALARSQFDQVAGQRHAVVVVAGHLPRRAHPLRLVFGQAVAEPFGVLGVGGGAADDAVVEPGGVHQQVAYGDRPPRIAVLDGEAGLMAGEISVHVGP